MQRRIVADAKGEPIRLETAQEAENGEDIKLTLDPAIVSPTYNQLQQIRGFYEFGHTLDVLDADSHGFTLADVAHGVRLVPRLEGARSRDAQGLQPPFGERAVCLLRRHRRVIQEREQLVTVPVQPLPDPHAVGMPRPGTEHQFVESIDQPTVGRVERRA